MMTENAVLQTKYAQKFDLWEKKLFDLSLRNALLSVRLTAGALPIRSAGLAPMAGALRTGTSFAVCPDPFRGEQEQEAAEAGTENRAEVQKAVLDGLSSGKLYTDSTAHEIELRLRRLSRLSKTAVEETGSSNLYWGLGLLKWYDKKSRDQERYAPLLLLPAEIRRRQGMSSYSVSAVDEEPLLNQTLLEKLGIDYGLSADGWKELLTDRDGDGEPELEAVLDKFRELIAPMEGWEILESVCIGIFSYAKYMMWEDLHYHRERIAQSPVVRSLAGGSIAWKEDMGSWQEELASQDLLSPVSLDASQQLAVRAAAAGKSFVLHGPPGTGKSQTITAVIANALAGGKTVLFVAEKMAALSVVQKRLEDLGLGEYCLELYSRKTRKKEFIEKINRAVQAGAAVESSSYAETEEQYAQRSAELENYRQHLHEEKSAGMSVWQLMDLYESFPEDIPLQTMNGAEAAALTAQELAQRCDMLEKLIAAGRAVGHPQNHPLTPVGESEYTQEYRAQMEERITSYLSTVDALENALEEYTLKTGEERPAGLLALKKTQAVTEELDRWKSLPQEWASAPNPGIFLEKAVQIAQHYQNMTQCKERLLKVFAPEILDLAEEDADRLRGDYQSVRRAWALPRYFGKRRLEAELKEYAAEGQTVRRQKLGQYTQDIQYYQREYRLYKESLDAYGGDLDLFRDEKGGLSVKKMLQAAAAAAQSTQRLRILTGGDSVRMERAGKPGFKKEIAALNSAFMKVQEEETALKAFLQYRESEEVRRRADKDWFGAQRQFCSLLKEHGRELREWMLWNHVCGEAGELGLEPQVEAYREGMAHEMVLPSYRRSWARAALRENIEKDPVLNGFSGTLYEKQAEQFRELDAELTKLAKEEIRHRLAERVPDFVREASENPSLSVFRKILMSGGRGMTIREMLSAMAPVLPRVCPCMLMSPVSAAQYLDPDREPFDLVVFDEASQITTSNAVGTLARGRACVIVGDPNQMPPTSFFTQEVELTEDPLADDLGSILEDCIAVNMPQLYLAWHYRSRHESLIAFSNEHFYGSRLFTFPSADDGVRKVRLVYSDGQFESGSRRINLAEAQAVVAELMRRSRDPELRGQSVGVVTFNIQQQTLIEDLYEEALSESASLSQWDAAAQEPVFIKNLENVQGDERDVILFSTTYGPTPEGRMSLNFGPLNREGGWRRLNVAVTRARMEMLVFTSIHPERAGLDKSLSQGVRMLDAFLRYADGGSLPEEGSQESLYTGGRPSPRRGALCGIAQEIRDRLGLEGWDADCGVGRSSFRVDVGVQDPEDPQRYQLGILLDGDPVTPQTTVRDLEIGRVSVLKGLGWKLLPVRTVDWYDSRSKVIDTILACLEEE